MAKTIHNNDINTISIEHLKMPSVTLIFNFVYCVFCQCFSKWMMNWWTKHLRWIIYIDISVLKITVVINIGILWHPYMDRSSSSVFTSAWRQTGHRGEEVDPPSVEPLLWNTEPPYLHSICCTASTLSEICCGTFNWSINRSILHSSVCLKCSANV